MKTFIVTSALTFVPNNYNDFIIEMSFHPHVAGLIVIENRNLDYLLKGLVLIFTGAAPKMGLTLIKNYFGHHTDEKKSAFEAKNKKICFIKDINSSEAIDLIKKESVDLILNARTRSLFKKSLLAAPKLGCINIHHGLLPDQRGLMCDFWAHLENKPFGFSIHQMTAKLDDGHILRRQEVITDRKDYLCSILEGSKIEAKVCMELLNQIANENKISGEANLKTEQTQYRKNPGLLDFYKLRLKKVKI